MFTNREPVLLERGLEPFDEVLETSGIADGVDDISTFHALGVDPAVLNVSLALELGVFGWGDQSVAVIVGLLLGVAERRAARKSDNRDEKKECFHCF